MKQNPEVYAMSEDEVREYLEELIESLDNLDETDYFGPSGWRSFLMGE